MAPVQVGSFCYADLASAAGAACAAQVPSSTVSGPNVVTLSCSGVSVAGNMVMQTSVAPVDGSASAVSYTVQVSPSFPPCSQSDVVAALTTVAVAMAVVYVSWWGYKRLSSLLLWGRGEV